MGSTPAISPCLHNCTCARGQPAWSPGYDSHSRMSVQGDPSGCVPTCPQSFISGLQCQVCAHHKILQSQKYTTKAKVSTGACRPRIWPCLWYLAYISELTYSGSLQLCTCSPTAGLLTLAFTVVYTPVVRTCSQRNASQQPRLSPLLMCLQLVLTLLLAAPLPMHVCTVSYYKYTDTCSQPWQLSVCTPPALVNITTYLGT